MGESEFTIKNSMELAEKIREYDISPHESMVSFDVLSLFTKIPVQLAIDTARNKLENDPALKEPTVWSVDDIVWIFFDCLCYVVAALATRPEVADLVTH